MAREVSPDLVIRIQVLKKAFNKKIQDFEYEKNMYITIISDDYENNIPLLVYVHGFHLQEKSVGWLLLDFRHREILHVVVEHGATVQSRPTVH